MVSKNISLISINKITKENLAKLKLHPSLSYNDVIVQLLEIRDNVVKREVERKEQEYALKQVKAEIDKLVEDNNFQQKPPIPVPEGIPDALINQENK